jgi:hypothetical protein
VPDEKTDPAKQSDPPLVPKEVTRLLTDIKENPFGISQWSNRRWQNWYVKHANMLIEIIEKQAAEIERLGGPAKPAEPAPPDAQPAEAGPRKVPNFGGKK